MEKSTGIKLKKLKVDGGASANNLLMQFQSDILGIEIERPMCVETTALGAAYLAGLSQGVYSSTEEIKKNRKIEKSFSPIISCEERNKKISIWRKAVKRSLLWKEE
jgi:glycerol kinase